LEEGAGIFPEMADMTTDELYRIDTETGIKELVSGLPGGYNISNLEVSADGENLFFTDSRTGEIHKLDLN
jgi:sugar lactone lactonase YvrE